MDQTRSVRVIKGISLVTPIYSVIYSVSNAFKALLDFFTASEHIVSIQLSYITTIIITTIIIQAFSCF